MTPTAANTLGHLAWVQTRETAGLSRPPNSRGLLAAKRLPQLTSPQPAATFGGLGPAVADQVIELNGKLFTTKGSALARPVIMHCRGLKSACQALNGSLTKRVPPEAMREYLLDALYSEHSQLDCNACGYTGPWDPDKYVARSDRPA